MLTLKLALALYGVMSLVALIAFWVDKRAAQLGERRIPERWLHTVEWLGGWPGALVAAQIFRHKRQKFSYMIWLYIGSALHVILWVARIF